MRSFAIPPLSLGDVRQWQSGKQTLPPWRSIVQIVEVAKGNVQNRLPEEIREYVSECYKCKVEVMDVLELVDAICAKDRIEMQSPSGWPADNANYWCAGVRTLT